MPPQMLWLATIVRLAIAPVCLGALVVWIDPYQSGRDVAAGIGLALLSTVHLAYWSRPWPAEQRRAVVAAAAMVLTNIVLLYVLDLSQPLLWLYPALVAGSGLRPRAAVAGVGLMALAAGAPAELQAAHLVRLLGPEHAILLAVALAGFGMTAVRQLIAVNADLHATRMELAELAVSAEQERLARELHDVLGRTLSLIAIKAELAGRLSASGETLAKAEIDDVLQLAREAMREVRASVTGGRAPSISGELSAATMALRTVGIETSIDAAPDAVAPAHEAMVAWALREAVTNVVRHSGARRCRISLQAIDGITALEVVDDGRGAIGAGAGTGLDGLARRVHDLGGSFDAGSREAGGFRLRMRLGASASRPQAELAR